MGDEGNEGHGSNEGHEGHEGHEEEGSEQDRKGPLCQVRCLPRNQGQDCKRLDQERLGEEQDRQDCQQEAAGERKALYAKFAKNWISAVQKARKALGVKGFVAIKKGSPLYKKANE